MSSSFSETLFSSKLQTSGFTFRDLNNHEQTQSGEKFKVIQSFCYPISQAKPHINCRTRTIILEWHSADPLAKVNNNGAHKPDPRDSFLLLELLPLAPFSNPSSKYRNKLDQIIIFKETPSPDHYESLPSSATLLSTALSIRGTRINLLVQ